MVFTASLLGAQHIKGIVRRTSRQACLLCPWAKHLTGRPHFYVVDRWRGQAVDPSWWPSLPEDSQIEPERARSVCTSCMMVRTSSSNNEDLHESTAASMCWCGPQLVWFRNVCYYIIISKKIKSTPIAVTKNATAGVIECGYFHC